MDGGAVSRARRRDALRHRRGYAGAGGQRRAPGRIRAGLPLAAARRGRPPRSAVGLSGPKQSLRLRELPQPRAHELGLVQPLQRGSRRPLRAALLDGRDPRLENLLSMAPLRYQAHEHEAWGALFDRTRDGRILQRNFGGHRYPRLAHVGDRTGLEMIRTLQDHGIHQGIDVHMELTLTALVKDGGRIAGAFGYDREKGLLHVFRARAVVLATGGIGKAYQITSNSWEYTGDGHALAYHAGAELMDMEFVQFHPTGMIWPPSVQGILVTEGVRGEGGVLLNKAGRRFLFDDIPEAYKNQTADSEDEGFRYTQGDKSARRPPELLTRDHVARCIVREIREGRGSPHGGVFLDISWIKRRLPNAEEVIKKKLPSMYHQFMKLADIDITRQPMEVGPNTHYIKGGARVDPETQMSSVPGLFAAGECAAGLHGANRLGGNSP